jgi:hypothetical protein
VGRAADCAGEFAKFRGEGRLLLETDELIFRAVQRLVVPRSTIRSASVRDGWLEITHAGGRARFQVGAAAERWAHDILHPKSRIDKLEVKPDTRVALLGIDDAGFEAEVRARTSRVDTRAGKGPYDQIFIRVDGAAGLSRVETLARRITQAGAVWVITPKGEPALGHGPIVAAATAAGLVDTKTARFSATHTALKLVIPKHARR